MSCRLRGQPLPVQWAHRRPSAHSEPGQALSEENKRWRGHGGGGFFRESRVACGPPASYLKVIWRGTRRAAWRGYSVSPAAWETHWVGD